MGKFIDLTGKVFGRLIVVKRDLLERFKPHWRCKCECGNETISSGSDLRTGDKKSCGCLRKDRLRIDLMGKVFGKLTVIDRAEKIGNSTSQFWLCKCKCGNKHIASGQHLRENKVKSCGCFFDKTDEEFLYEAKQRFFKNVDKTGICWIWKGCLINNYGIMYYRKPMRVHRFSYLIHIGELNSEKMICHTCDNSLCVNPNHLYQGSAKDNSRDSAERCRIPSGENSHFAKLKKEDVRNILKSKKKGVDLAKQYGVSENHISRIRTGHSWKYSN